MGKHTPGPWKADGKQLWRVGKSYDDPDDPHVYLGEVADWCDQCKANLHLMAAAPEMYELLKEQIECYDKMPMSDLNYAGIEWIKRARAAIAKAEGRNHDEPSAGQR